MNTVRLIYEGCGECIMIRVGNRFEQLINTKRKEGKLIEVDYIQSPDIVGSCYLGEPEVKEVRLPEKVGYVMEKITVEDSYGNIVEIPEGTAIKRVEERIVRRKYDCQGKILGDVLFYKCEHVSSEEPLGMLTVYKVGKMTFYEDEFMEFLERYRDKVKLDLSFLG